MKQVFFIVMACLLGMACRADENYLGLPALVTAAAAPDPLGIFPAPERQPRFLSARPETSQAAPVPPLRGSRSPHRFFANLPLRPLL